MEESLRQLSEYLKLDYLTTDKFLMATVIISLIFAIVFCFFGYRAVRGIAAVFGFLIGAIVGMVVVREMSLQQPIDLIVILGAAFLLALLGFFLLRAGVFLIILLGVSGAVLPILQKYTSFEAMITAIISLVIGLVIAILAVIYLKPVVIVATAIIGAVSISQLVFTYLIHIRWSKSMEALVSFLVLVVFAAVGMIYQFASTSDLE